MTGVDLIQYSFVLGGVLVFCIILFSIKLELSRAKRFLAEKKMLQVYSDWKQEKRENERKHSF